MQKPQALTEAQLADIETRIVKGWVVRRDQLTALIAMARERNAIMQSLDTTQSQIGERTFL